MPLSQFTWARNPNWSRYYSSSEEIWQYFKDVSTKYDLERYVKLNTKVESATWDEEEGKWKLSILGADGSHFEDSCEILVNGSGVLKYVHLASWGSSVRRSGLLTLVVRKKFMAVPKNSRIGAIQGKAYAQRKMGLDIRLEGQNCGCGRWRLVCRSNSAFYSAQ